MSEFPGQPNPYDPNNQQQPYPGGGPQPYPGQPGPGGFGAPYGGFGAPNPTEKNAFNAWALGLAIFGFCCLPTAIAGAVMGYMGKQAAEQGRATNGGVAQAAFIIGIIFTVLSVIGTIYQISTGAFTNLGS
ncbi:DUF4190 domain-containing protein [Actinomyces slackii]|uniref:DUF4190 domain-containing protein n=1 Tax=Actinomyces slackii TaxID=52774 RepID=A0A3S4SU49_9ACTO|nr:DUF4190 domain-containing protein [Actinomyces slackii]VEG75117.1 Uncharacterised protein [Actinomyces slackii]